MYNARIVNHFKSCHLQFLSSHNQSYAKKRFLYDFLSTLSKNKLYGIKFYLQPNGAQEPLDTMNFCLLLCLALNKLAG